MVGETRWERGMSGFCKRFTTAKTPYFERADLESARWWVAGDE